MKKVKEIIAGQELVTTKPSMTAIGAILIMRKKQVHSLLVFEEDNFVGIVTMTDLATKALGNPNIEVSSLMTRASAIKYVSENDSYRHCMSIFNKNTFHHLVVKNKDGKITGVVSTLDLMIAENDSREEAAETAKEFLPS